MCREVLQWSRDVSKGQQLNTNAFWAVESIGKTFTYYVNEERSNIIWLPTMIILVFDVKKISILQHTLLDELNK